MTATPYPKLTAKKPHGGFHFLIVQQLCLVWWAYRSRLIQLRDLRVWFAAHEMVARRCQLAPDQVSDYTPKELHGLVGGVGGEHLRAAQRRVPVPRQAVRLIAGGCRATVIATMLGHLIRCLYYRDHHCISGGWCKASWIAEVFGVDLRSVKAARKHLVAIGWLQTVPTPQRLCNRWGSYTRISLSWTRVALEHAAADRATPPPSAPPPPPPLRPSK